MDPVTTSAEEINPAAIPPERIPTHVAIIMDGNGRWARQRGLPRLAGHRAGTENLRTVLRACVEFGVEILTIYAFSTENWGRPEDEVQGLMLLLEDVIDHELDDLDAEGVQIHHLGDPTDIDPSLQKKIAHAIDRTKDNDKLILNVAFNYGGRAEIVQAVRQIVEEGTPAEEITEELLSHHLYTSNLPDPDLVVRTSGEVRLSNFLIWQSAYAECYFADVNWPDFGREELWKALLHFAQRDRRFGLID